MKNLKQRAKITASILSVLLFVFNYKICDYFYFDNIDKWWGMKSNIYAVIVALVFYSSFIGSKGVLRLVLSIGMGLAVSNIVDKCFFNVISFNYNDVIMIILTVCFSAYNYLKNHNAKQ